MTIKIAHPKIASLKPTWAPFAGWSLIFMPFGETDAENDLFKRLRTTFDERSQERWRNNYALCPLPEDTYHVSYCDLINQGNQRLLTGEAAGGAGDTFALSAEPPPWLLQAIADAGLSTDAMRSPVEFGFSQVATSHGRMLGVMLEPIGNGLKVLLEARAKLQELLHKICGLPETAYAPHVTLGYFPNQEVGGHVDRDALPAFQDELRSALSGSVARFHAIGLYTFTDMISYKLSRKIGAI